MTAPYLIVSDIHFHGWSAFGGRNADGVSTRLGIILSELDRAAAVLAEQGGDAIVMAGDVFHVRGSIDPEVFNPVHAAITALTLQGFRFFAIPGNHDLKSRETTELGNAFQTLNALDGFTVVAEPRPLYLAKGLTPFFLPWISTSEGLRETMARIRADYDAADLAQTDLIMHAGVNGVLKGLPDHGLDVEEVASWGFKRVFAGHYHNHKVMADGKVISIGALTHQTWSDVGSKAGFTLVYPDRIQFYASRAPAFVEITDETDEDDIPLLVDGNYVRVRGKKATDAEITAMRKEFEALGAKGFSYQGVREVATMRASGATHKATTLAESIQAFLKDKDYDADFAADVLRDAVDLIGKASALDA